MDILLAAGLYLALLLLLIVALLFGENPAFARTPLPWVHWLLTDGACAGGAAVARRLLGPAPAAACARRCCEQRNPAAQLLFLALFGACFWAFWAYIFPMLPLPGVPAWHRATGAAAALACLALFLAAGRADPGAITPANLAAHLALYPHDGVLYQPKDCPTCRLPRPARSRHCGACGSCIARLDHHCIWINSCVGLLNMRHFLAFLLATAALCCYAAVLGFLALRGELAQRGASSIAYLHPNTGRLVYLSDSRAFLLRFLAAQYGPQLAATFFAGAVGCIVLGFSAYQAWLICTGLTTAEVHKRREAALLRELQREVREMEQQLAEPQQLQGGSSNGRSDRAAAGGAGATTDGAAGGGAAGAAGGGGSGSSRGGGIAAAAAAPPAAGMTSRQRRPPPLPNYYDHGPWSNLSEVLFPHRHLRLALAGSGGGSSGGGSKKEA